jgi:hypothetical protein
MPGLPLAAVCRLEYGFRLAWRSVHAGHIEEEKPMTGRTILAVVLICLGIVGLGYGGFTYTHQKKVLDIGSVEITRNEHERLPIPPLVGGVLLITGVALLFGRGSGSV